MRMRNLMMAALAALALACTGSALAAGKPESARPGTGLAFGAFDITESELAVTHVVLMRIKPTRMYMGSSGEKATMTYSQGEFYSPNLEPGTYVVNGFFSGNQFFALERSLRSNTFQVEPGRTTYAGSYRLVLSKGGVFRRDKGSFERIDAPEAEARLLQWLATELAGTGWATSIAARRAEAGTK